MTHALLYIIQIVCLFVFVNYYSYVIWIPIFTAIENIVISLYVNKHYNRYLTRIDYSKDDFKLILTRVKDLFGHKLSQVVTNSVDTIVISAFLGLQMVTIYNNYYYLMSAIAGILDILYQAIIAGIGNSLFSESQEKNEKDFKKLTILNSWMIGWCSICFLCLYQPMMKMWMGKELMLDLETVFLLVIYFYTWKMRQVILIYKDAAGMWSIDRWKPYIEIIVNLIVNIILVQLIGINGIVIATIVSMLFVSIPWETVAFFKERFHQSAREYLKLVMCYFSFTLITGTITYVLCDIVPDRGIMMFALKLIICMVIPNVIILVLGIGVDQHKETVKFAISLTPLRKYL